MCVCERERERERERPWSEWNEWALELGVTERLEAEGALGRAELWWAGWPRPTPFLEVEEAEDPWLWECDCLSNLLEVLEAILTEMSSQRILLQTETVENILKRKRGTSQSGSALGSKSFERCGRHDGMEQRERERNRWIEQWSGSLPALLYGLERMTVCLFYITFCLIGTGTAQ